MTEYEIKHNQQLIRFKGTLLGEHSSERYQREHASLDQYRFKPGRDDDKLVAWRDGARRWHEVRLYRTIDGQYVVEKTGRTELPGETDRSTVHVSDTAHGAVECLQTADDDGVVFMTRASREAVERAAVKDPAIHDAYYVRNLTA